MRPPRPMVPAARKGPWIRLLPSGSLRAPSTGERAGKGAPGGPGSEKGPALAQDKPAARRGVLRRPNLPRSPSLSISFFVCFKSRWTFAARRCFVSYCCSVLDSNVTGQTLQAWGVCFISNGAQIPCKSGRCTVWGLRKHTQGYHCS